MSRRFGRVVEPGMFVMREGVCSPKGSRGSLLLAARLFLLSRDLLLS